MPARKIKIRKPETNPATAKLPSKGFAPETYCMFCGARIPPFHETVVCKAQACRQKQAQLQQLRRDKTWNGQIEEGYIFQCTQACIF